MAKGELVCPFTNKLCNECLVYRGRHYYIRNCKQNQGYIRESKENPESAVGDHSADLQAYFQALQKLIEPRADAGSQSQAEPKIRLKVVYVESGEARVWQPEEARTWDWGNPEVVRIIDGFQITRWDKLVEVLLVKAGKGYQEVKLYEAPRFMVLAGG